MKKFFSILAICVFALTGCFFLTACGDSKCYITIENCPEHITCEIKSNETVNYDDKGQYFNKNAVCEIIIAPNSAEYGIYEIADGFKVFINNEEMNLTKEQATYNYGEEKIYYLYKGTFTITNDITVTFNGYAKEVEVNVSLSYNHAIDTNEIWEREDVYIEFEDPQILDLTENIYSLNSIKNLLDSNTVNSKISVLEEIKIYSYTTSKDNILQMFNLIINENNYNLDSYVYQSTKDIGGVDVDVIGLEFVLNFTEDSQLLLSPIFISDYYFDFIGIDENMQIAEDIDDNFNPLLTASIAKDNNTLDIDLLKYSDENYKNFYDTMKLKIGNVEFVNGTDYTITSDGKISISNLKAPYLYISGTKIDGKYLYTYEIYTDIAEKLVNAGKTVDINLDNIALIYNNTPIEDYQSFQFGSGALYPSSNIATFLADSTIKLELFYEQGTSPNFTSAIVTDVNGQTYSITINDSTESDLKISSSGSDGSFDYYIIEFVSNINIQEIEFFIDN